jgi:kinesin family protein C2/C3
MLQYEKQLHAASTNYAAEIKERRRLHNQLLELRGNIRVFVRVRPLSTSEKAESLATLTSFPKADQISVEMPEGRVPRELQDGPIDKTFKFDRVFTPTDGQVAVFEETEALVTSVLDGYNVCIFAYGQTGSGKTHTMEGPQTDPGVSYRAVANLFHLLKEDRTDYDYKISVTLFEIYNEQIKDLLREPEYKYGQLVESSKYEIRKGARGMEIADLTFVEVHSQRDIIDILATGLVNRSVGATNMNERSSRSHSLLTIWVDGKNTITGVNVFGKLHLVDLAGSERLKDSGSKGVRLTEATYINKSLSALGNVISSLVGRKQHTPYRDSKLTHFLADRWPLLPSPPRIFVNRMTPDCWCQPRRELQNAHVLLCFSDELFGNDSVACVRLACAFGPIRSS